MSIRFLDDVARWTVSIVKNEYGMFPVFIGLLQTIDVMIYILSKTGALVLGHVLVY